MSEYEFYEWEQDEPGEPAEESEERKTWIWLGGYVQSLAPVVEAYLNSTDPAKRLHAFNRLDKYRSKRSDGDYADAVKTMQNLESVETPPSGARSGQHASKAGRRDPDTVGRCSRSGRCRAARRWKRLQRRQGRGGLPRPKVRAWIYSPKPSAR